MLTTQLNLDFNELQEGDIIFTSIPHYLYQAIEIGTRSPTSHVGIIFKENNQWVVAESKIPFSKISPLDEFIERSKAHWFSIKRVGNGLSTAQINSLKVAAKAKLGIRYDLSFNYHNKGIFCSKFVYDVYKEACNIEIGMLETLQALLDKNPNVSTIFWRIWFLGFIPLKNLTVTPHSQLLDPKLVEVVAHV